MLNVGLSFKKNKKDKIRKDTFFFKNKDNSFKDKDKDINVRNTLIKRRIYK